MTGLLAGALILASLNACEVLTKRDVGAVQGEAFVDAKLSSRAGVSQCFYQLSTFTKSVSVDVILDRGEEYWDQRFERDEEEKGKEREEEEEGEEKHPPLRVRGVGDEAFWAGGPLAGSLYVRKGDAVLRVSVGGPWSEQEKIVRSKRLASKALRRLSP